MKNKYYHNYWEGFKTKSPFSVIGKNLIIISLFVLIPLVLVLPYLLTASHERYDYENIIANGEVRNARLRSVTIKPNVILNNIKLRIIEYDYQENGQTKYDKFSTIDLIGIDSLRNKDSIRISVLNDESVIQNLQPGQFHYKMFWILPVLFLILGCPLFLIGHFAGMKYIRNSRHSIESLS